MSVVDFPPPDKPTELLIGPFEEWRVLVDGREIPRLTGFRDGDGICFVVDHRFACTVPHDIAHSVAYVIANALAVGAGYSHLGAEIKDMPFAPRSMSLDAPP